MNVEQARQTTCCTHGYPLIHSIPSKQVSSSHKALLLKGQLTGGATWWSTVSIVRRKGIGVTHEVSDTENSRLNPSIPSRNKNAPLTMFLSCVEDVIDIWRYIR